MSHVVSPTSFRSGKTWPWPQSSLLINSNSTKIISQNINNSAGLENTLSYIIQKSNYFIVKSSSALSKHSNIINLKALYYPLVAPLVRRRHFPTYFLARKASRLVSFNTNWGALYKLWSLQQLEFQERFIRTNRRVQLNWWLTKRFSRGSGRYSKKKFILSRYKFKNKLNKWISNKSKLSSKIISNSISKRVGYRVRVKLVNIYKYLSLKHKLNKNEHQDHIWGEYHYNKKFFQSYYDVINAIYLLSRIKGSERLLVSIIQYAMLRIHRRKIKPKRFFYFLDKAVKKINIIKNKFFAFRIIITGKLKGGTARTSSFSAGFGWFPRQTLAEKVIIEFGDIRSKYGSFGVKVLTWRKV